MGVGGGVDDAVGDGMGVDVIVGVDKGDLNVSPSGVRLTNGVGLRVSSGVRVGDWRGGRETDGIRLSLKLLKTRARTTASTPKLNRPNTVLRTRERRFIWCLLVRPSASLRLGGL